MSNASPFPYKVTIAAVIVSTILFRTFIWFCSSLISSLQIERLLFDIHLKVLAISIIELIGVLVFFFYLNKRLLIPKSTSFLYYILAIILAAVYVFAQEWLNIAYDFVFNTNYEEQIDYNFTIPVFTKLLVGQAFLIPIAEELFFRKFIQKGLEECYGGYIAIIVSCLLFTVVHFSNFHNMYLVFFGGFIASILYYKSKSIIPSLIFHISWNYFVLAF